MGHSTSWVLLMSLHLLIQINHVAVDMSLHLSEVATSIDISAVHQPEISELQKILNSKRQCLSSWKKLVTASLASAIAPTSGTDITAYERNVAVMIQLYEKQSSSDYTHMMKLLKITHEMRRSKINTSTSSALAIKEKYPFFGHIKWVCRCVCFIILQ